MTGNPLPDSRLVSADSGRLQIHGPFTRVLHDAGLDSFESLWSYADGTLVRKVGTRETRRIEIATADGPREFYLKRFGAPRWRDAIRTLLHLGWPIHGARNEWDAIWRIRDAGIPTVNPAAFGESGNCSLLLTEALPARCNLLEYAWETASTATEGDGPDSPAKACPKAAGTRERTILTRVAELARRFHAAGLHHQDFYLNHLLLCGEEDNLQVHLIDLGRVRQMKPLGLRWIVKDLSQLDFSARMLPRQTRLRFLRMYLDRPFRSDDSRLIRRISFKSRRIARHTAKHDL